jgi:hypothetical protein
VPEQKFEVADDRMAESLDAGGMAAEIVVAPLRPDLLTAG